MRFAGMLCDFMEKIFVFFAPLEAIRSGCHPLPEAGVRKSCPEGPVRRQGTNGSDYMALLSRTGLISCVLLFLALPACLQANRPAQLGRLIDWPQEPLAYSVQGPRPFPVDRTDELSASADFLLDRHFQPWQGQGAMYNATTVFGDLAAFSRKKLFGENLRPRSKHWFDQLRAKCRMQAYPSLDRKAVTVRRTDVRLLPTSRPAFRDPSLAGEGFPFDYLQYSSLWANTPVHISHASADKAWYFVETAHVYGWVKAEDLAFVSDQLAEQIQSMPLVALTRDGFAIKDRRGRFVFQGRIGMLLPVVSEPSRGYGCLALTADQNGQAVSTIVTVDSNHAAPFPLAPSRAACADIARELLGETYGWGGLYGNRDCSATMRDYCLPFGIWLPRNSSQQAEVGRRIDLQQIPDEDKEALLLERGVPFLSLVTMPGHVMLYIGSRNGRAAVLHTLWGLRTEGFWGREGRLIVGQTVITDLAPGAGVFFLDRPQAELLHRIDGIIRLDHGVGSWDQAPYLHEGGAAGPPSGSGCPDRPPGPSQAGSGFGVPSQGEEGQ